jgi:glutathione S-transferase
MPESYVILYELGGPPLDGRTPRRYSVFSWRTRLALAHKGLQVESRPVKISDKAAIAFSGQGKVPVLRDGETVVYDSFRIAEYLEQTYPALPSLFGGETGHALARFVNSWVDRQLVGTLFPSLMLENEHLLEADDAAHLRGQVEGVTGKSLEELAAGRNDALASFRRQLDPVRSALRTHPFLSGSTPRYPDHILFSIFQWARVVTPTRLTADGDLLATWFDHMLDAYDGLGRREPPREAA